MDTVCYKKWVQNSVSCPSLSVPDSSSLFEDSFLRPRQDSASESGSGIHAGERCHRTSLFASPEERLLQPHLFGSQKVGRLETGYRSVSTESVHSHSPFQNGDNRLSSSCLTEERLGHFFGPTRCLLSYSDPSRVQEISPFSFHGENISVSSLAIRAFPSSICFHQSCENSCEALPSFGHAPSYIPGRLASAIQLPVPFSVTQRSASADSCQLGVCSQLGQIRAHSQPEVLLSGSSNRPDRGSHRSIVGQNYEIANTDSEVVGFSYSVCQADSFFAWSDGIYVPSSPVWQGSQTFASVARKRPLVPGSSALGLQYFSRSLVQASCVPVAEQGLSSFNGATVSTIPRLSSVHGCESSWLGRSFGRPFSFRPMVCSLEGSTHQCSGTQSSLACSQILSSGSVSQPCIAVNRQYNCGFLPEQRRGGPVSNPVVYGNKVVSLVCKTTGVFDGQVRSREAECASRLPFAERADHSYRVDSSQGHSVSDFSFLGSSSHRSVCHKAKQSTSSIHFSIPRPFSLGSGCNVPVMEGNDCICISSHSTSNEGLIENGEGDLSGHPDSSLLGESSVLPSSAVPCSSTSNPSSIQEGSPNPTSFPALSSEARNIQPARLVVLQGGLEKAGFSKKSAERVCAAKRASTQSLYNYRWNTWMDWCLQREMDPINPSVMTLADFLIFLFEEKKLCPVSVKGYRSAISSTLKHLSSVDFSSHPVLSDIIRSMELEKPVSNRIVPLWDLALVLESFKKTPFEPMASCSLKCLTQKTVFLIALASGRRRSEIHALSASPGSVNFSADKSAVILHFFPGFLAKNQAPSVAGVPIEFPALSCSAGNMDNYLCPVRALRIYLRRTKSFRRERKRLFISYVKNYDKEISASSISRWIVDSVRFAYEQSRSNSAVKVCAHELRALSTSFAWLNYVPLDSILRAGYWRSENSFIKFYLRDTTGQHEKLFSLGPVVAAQTVITSSDS